MSGIISAKEKPDRNQRRQVDVERFHTFIRLWVRFIGPRPMKCSQLANLAISKRRNGEPNMERALELCLTPGTSYPAIGLDKLLRKFENRKTTVNGLEYVLSCKDKYWSLSDIGANNDIFAEVSSLIGPDNLTKLREAGFSITREGSSIDSTEQAVAEDPQRALFRAWLDRFGLGVLVKASAVVDAASFDAPLSSAINALLPKSGNSSRSLGWYLTSCRQKPIKVDDVWYIISVRYDGSNGNRYAVIIQ